MPNITLKRIGSSDWGTLGIFYIFDGNRYSYFCLTLEPEIPAIPPGVYNCSIYTEGRHPYPVYQVLNVPGHNYIEIHIGNFKTDTEGCILLGGHFPIVAETLGIFESKNTFDKFMIMQNGQPFQLTVI